MIYSSMNNPTNPAGRSLSAKFESANRAVTVIAMIGKHSLMFEPPESRADLLFEQIDVARLL